MCVLCFLVSYSKRNNHNLGIYENANLGGEFSRLIFHSKLSGAGGVRKLVAGAKRGKKYLVIPVPSAGKLVSGGAEKHLSSAKRGKLGKPRHILVLLLLLIR